MPQSLDDILTSAKSARLIPTIADSRKEERIVSILLATLPRVRPFATQVLERCGQRVGKSSAIATYTEVDFPSADGTGKDRPDGLLCLTTRKSRWTAILEAKIDKAEIEEQQVHRYADLAKRYNIDAIITLSNQLVPLPTHVPYSLPKRISNQMAFFHFSWVSIATHAHLILRNRNSIDPDQAFILREMTRYFDHDSSGVKYFDRMNAEWRDLVFGRTRWTTVHEKFARGQEHCSELASGRARHMSNLEQTHRRAGQYPTAITQASGRSHAETSGCLRIPHLY